MVISVHGASPSISSLTESYEASPIGSPFITSSGFNYGSASTLGGTPGIPFKGPSLQTQYTISEGIMSDSIPEVSYGPNIQIPHNTHHSISNNPSNMQTYSQQSSSSVSGSNGENSYVPNTPLDLSSLYGSMMRPALGPIIPMRHGPYGHHVPSGHAPNFPSHPPINSLYGKPNNHQKPQQSKYGLRFPLYRPSSALSLYKVSSE